MSHKRTITHTFGWQLDKGLRREKNHDSLAVVNVNVVSKDLDQSVGVYVVADGVGVAREGAEASRLAVQASLEETLRHIHKESTAADCKHWLQTAAWVAHRRIQARNELEESDAATTLLIALIVGPTAYVLNVGDSRAYILRNEQLSQITRDHTMAQALVDAGIISREDAIAHPRRNVLLRVVGPDKEFDSDVFTVPLLPGDYLLLCTDGLYTEVSETEIADIITGSESPQVASETLTRRANEAGGRDNIAVVVIEIRDDNRRDAAEDSLPERAQRFLNRQAEKSQREVHVTRS